MMLPFFAALLALLIVAMVRSEGRMAGTAAILLANWVIEVAVIQLTGEQFPWMLFLTVDYLSALGILAMSYTRWQLAVISIYALQVICHAGYGLSDQGAWASYHYWWALTYTGWGQLVAMGGWIAYALVGGPDGAGSRLPSYVRRHLARGETHP